MRDCKFQIRRLFWPKIVVGAFDIIYYFLREHTISSWDSGGKLTEQKDNLRNFHNMRKTTVNYQSKKWTQGISNQSISHFSATNPYIIESSPSVSFLSEIPRERKKDTHKEKEMEDTLSALRSLMASHSPPLDALVVPSEDYHQVSLSVFLE